MQSPVAPQQVPGTFSKPVRTLTAGVARFGDGSMENPMDVRNKVFISYVHEDDHVAGDLKKHLTTRLRSEASV
jgi:hypothetical protein